jgi:hypothetical protein
LYLANDSGTTWIASKTVGVAGTLQNSQCSVNLGASSVAGSGNNLTLNVSLTFSAGFAGTKNIYMEVYDGLDSGWQAKGTWTAIAAPGPPVAISVTPSSGSGGNQTFAFAFSDAKGQAAISTASIIINGSLSGLNGCYLYYSRPANALYLANDGGTSWIASKTVGVAGTLQNSQCSVNLGASSVAGSGNNLTLNVSLTFSAGFAGTKNIYMEVYDGVDSGWQAKGTWTAIATI